MHSSFRWNPHTFALTSVFPADNFCANCVTCSPFYHTPYLFIFNKVFKPKMLAQFTLMCSHFQIKFIPFALFSLIFSSFNYCAFHPDEKTFLKIPYFRCVNFHWNFKGGCATLSLLAVIYLDCFYSNLQYEKCPLWYFKLLIVLLCECAGALT